MTGDSGPDPRSGFPTVTSRLAARFAVARVGYRTPSSSSRDQEVQRPEGLVAGPVQALLELAEIC